MSSTPIPWTHIRNVMVLFSPLWLGAALLFGGIGASYALVKRDFYQARQPLVVRDEATSSLERLGRFSSQTELKAAQETILEMTRNPEVVREALIEIGPHRLLAGKNWPSPKTVDTIALKRVNLVASQGSEFGNNEVVYLQVEAETRERAQKFCAAIYSNLTKQLRKVRQVRADSVIDELSYAVDLASKNLDDASSKMREIEIQFGIDLGELRNLNDTISGDGTNRRSLEKTNTELQFAELKLQEMEAVHEVLTAGSQDPSKLLITGSTLLANQPTLKKLKEGMIAAQIKTSELTGIYTEGNPKLMAARDTEAEILRCMQQEANAVREAMQPHLRLQRDRVNRLSDRRTTLQDRLDLLATIRIDYSKLESSVKSRTLALGEAQQALADANASRTAALSTNLITELGPPRVGDDPIGPGRTVLTGASTIAGLVFGLGAVFLVAPAPAQISGGRRWSDYLGAGRQASDRGEVEVDMPAGMPEHRAQRG